MALATRPCCLDSTANGNLTHQTISAGSGTIQYDSSTWWVANLAKRIAQKSASTSEATTYVGGLYEKFTDRGYTGHEHIDHVGLINMNGRIYDPEIGRFLSADPTTQFPESTQGWNRYSYCGNNPLSYTDPSGFSFLKSLMKVVGVVLNFIPVVGTFASIAWYNAMLVGFASGFLASGGNLQAGLLGGLGGALFYNIGFIANDAMRILAHGVASGGIAELGGGTFKAGLFGGIAGAAGGLGSRKWFGNPGTGGVVASIKRTLTASIAGGIGSVAGGGKFANGAKSAAFAHLLNDELPAHAPSIVESIRRHTSIQVGVGAGLEGRINIMGAHAEVGIGKVTESYKINAMLEDEGTFEASGPSLSFGLGDRLSNSSLNVELLRTGTITQIFDEDLGPSKGWREEISDGDFVYTKKAGELVPSRAESQYKLSLDVTLGVVRFKVESDVFRALHESD